MFLCVLQQYPGTSIEGPVVDRFCKFGAAYKYIKLRNVNGAGNSAMSYHIVVHKCQPSSLRPKAGHTAPTAQPYLNNTTVPLA